MSSENDNGAELVGQVPPLGMAAFLTDVPPGQHRTVTDLAHRRNGAGGQKYAAFHAPPIVLYCSHSACQGDRVFRCAEIHTSQIEVDHLYRSFEVFLCSNCQRQVKTYAIEYVLRNGLQGDVVKLGEEPPFGPTLPSRLTSMAGGDRDLLIKGRRCESQGLGVGAFAYYRQVVEAQKDRILGEIEKVAQKVNHDDAAVEHIRAARKEQQFSRAIDMVKDAVPQSLLIDGHNPLTLLHSALSEGLHAQTDEECLESAHTIRLVLADLAERIAQVLRDEAELTKAIGRLTAPPRKKGSNASDSSATDNM